MLILFTVLQSLGISTDYLGFVVDELRSLDNPEELLKPLSTLPSQPTTNGFFSHTEVARFGHSKHAVLAEQSFQLQQEIPDVEL